MGKNPAFQFYVLDFMDDADGLSATSNGIWIRMLCKLHRAPRRGEVTATIDAWCRKCNCTEDELMNFEDENKVENVAVLTVTDGLLTVISRRMVRERKEREQANIRQKRYQERKQLTEEITGDDEKITPPSSSSSSSSSSNKEYTPDFESFWKIYPRKIEKPKAYKCWQARLKEGVKPTHLKVCADNYAGVCDALKTEMQFVKHPATFLGPNKPYEDYRVSMPIEAGEVKADLPLDDHGEPMVELAGGEVVSRKELGELIGFNRVVMTDKGWELKQAEGES